MTTRKEPFSISTRELENGIAVVDITGDIDLGNTSTLSDHLKSMIKEGRYRIILNLERAAYISSAGWGLFISLLKKTRDNSGDIKLMCMNEEVNEIFKMLSFSNVFPVFQNERDAVMSFDEN